jgi:hypothetical protein
MTGSGRSRAAGGRSFAVRVQLTAGVLVAESEVQRVGQRATPFTAQRGNFTQFLRGGDRCCGRPVVGAAAHRTVDGVDRECDMPRQEHVRLGGERLALRVRSTDWC